MIGEDEIVTTYPKNQTYRKTEPLNNCPKVWDEYQLNNKNIEA
ncbi:hypothetical protein Sps_03419 [Shewanella psychrophila]|uniref:Uncharacterized protein n=1 Tax=Shewanella psychrophila TaxID=225848 RepID=A0A1S6HSN4_9GAMM|nr:hypothetical protein Sps_03419 [Shewanella psychrophila]